MTSRLQDEIKQTKPFANLRQEAMLNLARTAAVVQHEVEQRLRPYGLSGTQYNVLRILRGAGAGGLCQYEVRERLVAQVPDVPRILTRMEKAGLVLRVRNTGDRRVMNVTLTATGDQLLTQLDGVFPGWWGEVLARLNDEDLAEFNRLLVLAR